MGNWIFPSVLGDSNKCPIAAVSPLSPFLPPLSRNALLPPFSQTRSESGYFIKAFFSFLPRSDQPSHAPPSFFPFLPLSAFPCPFSQKMKWRGIIVRSSSGSCQIFLFSLLRTLARGVNSLFPFLFLPFGGNGVCVLFAPRCPLFLLFLLYLRGRIFLTVPPSIFLPLFIFSSQLPTQHNPSIHPIISLPLPQRKSREFLFPEFPILYSFDFLFRLLPPASFSTLEKKKITKTWGKVGNDAR